MADKAIVQYKLKDGTPINIEVIDENSEFQRVSRSGTNDVIEATNSFEEALGYIAPAAQSVVDTFKELNTPQEIGLEFNLKFTAKAGVVIASVGTEASFKVSLKWKNG